MIKIFALIALVSITHAEFMCQQCHALMNFIEQISDSALFKKAIVNAVCLFSKTKAQCLKETYFYSQALPALVLGLIKPNITCKKLHFCHNDLQVDDDFEFITSLLSTRPPRNYPSANPANPSINILVVNDVHVDFEYTPGDSVNCTEELCCRKKADNYSQKAGKWGSIGSCDIPPYTFQNFVSHMKNDVNPDIVFWLGDNSPHVKYDGEYDLLRETKYITQELMRAYPYAKKVYPVYGNHEAIITDQADLINHSNRWIYDGIADMWESWLTKEAFKTFKEFGYYTDLISGTNLRVVAMNCFAFSAANAYNIQNGTNIYNQIYWLKDTLLAAEAANERVIIMSHFSPSHFMANRIFSRRFSAIVDRFSNIIVSQMYGHTHTDELNIFKSSDLHDYTGVAYVCAALSTFYYRQPSYRIFSFDSETYALQDIYQYRMYLDEVNAVDNPLWKLAYSFKEYYNLSSISYSEIGGLGEKIKSDENVYKQYIKMFQTEGGLVDRFATGKNERKFVICSLNNTNSGDMNECNGWNNMDGLEFTASMVFNLLTSKKWYYD